MSGATPISESATSEEADASADAVADRVVRTPQPRSSYRVAVIERPQTVAMRDATWRDPGADEVAVRLEGCGVCGSNVPVWEGRPWFEYPLVGGAPGHEGWGVVEAVGANVRDHAVGDRVALLSEHAYAEYDFAPANAVLKLPPECDGQAFPAEPLACAMNVFRRSDIQPGQTVAIIGIGFLGALLTQLCTAAGADVIAVSRREFACDIARTCGARDAVAWTDVATTAAAFADVAGRPHCERVIEATGQGGPLELAAELTQIRGRLVIAGYHQDGPRQVNLQLWNWRGIDVINAHEREPAIYLEGMREAIAAVAAGRLRPQPLFTHRYHLTRLADALECSRVRPDGFMKALITNE